MEGPCITWIVPDRHPGAPEGTVDAEIKHLVQVAEDQAKQVPFVRWPRNIGDAAGMIREALAHDRGRPENGGPGLVACLSKSGFASMRLHSANEHVAIGNYPYVLPLIVPAFAVRDLFVLNLNAKKVHLFEYMNGACREVPIPNGVPTSVDESNHGFTGPAPGANRTTMSASPGKLGGVHFGTGGDRQSAGTRVERLCVELDTGLRSLLNQRPLLLMGVREEIAAYRRVSDYEWLLDDEIDGNWDALGCTQIAQHAQRASIGEYQRMGKEIVAEAREMRDRSRASFDAREVLHAAIEGRVHRLCVRADTELMGMLPTTIQRAKIRENLINAAVAETLKKGGEIYVLPQEAMPAAEPICAILRY
jgi:hypothetical protein